MFSFIIIVKWNLKKHNTGKFLNQMWSLYILDIPPIQGLHTQITKQPFSNQSKSFSYIDTKTFKLKLE